MIIIRGKYIKVKCHKCNNEQNIFNKASTEVKCLVCGEVLAVNSGGRAEIKTKILQVLN